MGGSDIGPQIPPEIAARLGIKRANRASGSSSDEEDPATTKNGGGTIGPTMPPNVSNMNNLPIDDNCSSSDDDDDDAAAIGPSAALAGCTGAQALNQTLDSIEERAHNHDGDQDSADANSKRPDWMLVPPDSETSKTGLFDESWTRTPGKDTARDTDHKSAKRRKKKKHDEEPVEETPDMRRRRLESEDKAQWVREYNKQVRPKSLLEMHMEAKRSGKSKTSKKEKRHGHNDESDDQWKRHRFDRTRDLGSAPRRADAKRQREILNTMGFLADKYAPEKGSG
ncbi:hypothetical protein GGI22_003409 [Coemansia erecta]|nr:hypothetical protein GGI22_003409 [Coemansia erecta]